MMQPALNLPPQQGAVGWLDGFADAPIDRAGHVTVGQGGVHALVWPGDAQGSMEEIANRLLMVGEMCAVLPARPRQCVTSDQDLLSRLTQNASALRAGLETMGRSRQFSILVSNLVLPDAAEVTSLRDKSVMRQTLKASLAQAFSPIHDAVEAAQTVVQSTIGPLPCGQGKAALHVLTDLCDSVSLARILGASAQHNANMAVVGPLPPFAFSRSAHQGRKALAR